MREEDFLPSYHFFVYTKPVRTKKQLEILSISDITLQANCMSYVFVLILLH